MNNAFTMSRIESLENLTCISECLLHGHRTPERFALDILHDQVIRPDIVQRCNVWMIERRRRSRLPFEPIRELIFRLFYSDNAIETGVTGFENLSHAAGSDRLQYLIRSKSLTRRLHSRAFYPSGSLFLSRRVDCLAALEHLDKSLDLPSACGFSLQVVNAEGQRE